MTRKELIRNKEYVVTGFQLKLLNLIEDYMQKNNLNREKLSKHLQVSKGYVSQLLNVSYDHKLSKLVELALACNSMPLLYFVDLDKFTQVDAQDMYYELTPTTRPKLVEFSTPVVAKNHKADKDNLVPIQPENSSYA